MEIFAGSDFSDSQVLLMGQAPEILRPTVQLETSLLGQFLHA